MANNVFGPLFLAGDEGPTGPTGPTGPAGTGISGALYKGAWDSSSNYTANDIVYSPVDTRTYITISSVSGGGDPSASAGVNWFVLDSFAQELNVSSATGSPTLAQSGILSVSGYSLTGNAVYSVAWPFQATCGMTLSANDSVLFTIHNTAFAGAVTTRQLIGGSAWAGGTNYLGMITGYIKTPTGDTFDEIVYQFAGANASNWLNISSGKVVIVRQY